jgi:cellulose synthase (UDP-forming)
MTDPPATALAVGWAALHILFLGRVIAEAVLGPRREAGRIEERKAGARIARARPWRAPASEAAEIAM